ncbi:hypothetical protein ABB37_03755 [Leptomonas pyrrhocoris]|uniref:Uncharacterized protein n=1 Tax=Leptomonas pyrrhocoris TaxID=157538 RepID=A0A0M9G3H1_LEPPY|nr:hypothetical protein ABB37_03755 [Leptomonas pyrrhocoris]KPA81376.1 hypothetical protein ABB37_03755 [Leptomonas pyrrhocoris]|eukprot:XP_015659815.1 hypothetical protein ABB37_03755 [Leptomonas pyrrhocoris]
MMALVISDEVTQEAQRILACQNSFEVLQLSPEKCTKQLVMEQYEAKVALFKRLFRNKLALQAKAKLDNAKMRLSDPMLRDKEAAGLREMQRDVQKDYVELKALEDRTSILEIRAAALRIDEKSA